MSKCNLLGVADKDLTVSELASFVADNDVEVVFDSQKRKWGIPTEVITFRMRRGNFGVSKIIPKKDLDACRPRVFAEVLNRMLQEIDVRENLDLEGIVERL